MNNVDNTKKMLSVVCTVYKGELLVNRLLEELEIVLNSLPYAFEVILVDDASPDSSWNVIQNICNQKKYVKGLRLSRNFGQQIAMSAGVKFAEGDYVIIMDGDLQNPPSAIASVLTKINDGYDIVYTVSKVRNNLKDELTSRLFWFVLTKIFKINIVKDQLMMKGMTRKFVDKYNRYQEVNRTVSGITNDIGMSYATIGIENRKRISGKSSYSFFRRFNLMIDVVISLSSAPLNFMIFAGLFIFLGTIICSVYYLFQYLFYADITPGFTSIMLALFFFGSIIVLMLGFIGRYLSNIYMEVRQRPLFMIQEKLNFNSQKSEL